MAYAHRDRCRWRALRPAPGGGRGGQALIESCLVLALMCLIFFGVFQVARLYAAQEILDYAAGRGLRAHAVGFNRFMVFKTIRVGAIPNAGRLLAPASAGGPAAQHALEAPRIPLYLEASHMGQLSAILDYEDWPTLEDGTPTAAFDGTARLTLEQQWPLTMPFHRTFYAADAVTLRGESVLDHHAALYLNDEGW